jgi:hypothetical protein
MLHGSVICQNTVPELRWVKDQSRHTTTLLQRYTVSPYMCYVSGKYTLVWQNSVPQLHMQTPLCVHIDPHLRTLSTALSHTSMSISSSALILNIWIPSLSKFVGYISFYNLKFYAPYFLKFRNISKFWNTKHQSSTVYCLYCGHH